MQKLTKASRYAAFGKIGFDIDMVNACFSIIGLMIQKKTTIKIDFPSFTKCKNIPTASGNFYHDTTMKVTKIRKKDLLEHYSDLFQKMKIPIYGRYCKK